MQCANHPQRAATNLCLDCGKWYCQECMAAIMPKPVCKSCSRYRNAGSQAAQGNEAGFRAELSLPAISAKFLARSGLIIANILLGALAIFLNIQYGIWFFYVLFGVTVFLHIPLSFLFSKGKKKQGAKRGSINEAQLETLFRLADGKVTAKRLAAATGTDLKTAEDYLNTLALENKLSVSTNETEMIYSKSDPLLLK